MTRSLHRPGAHLALMALLSFTLSCGGGDGGSTTPTPNPTPTITALVRDTATAGTTSFSLIISGSDFMPGVIGTFDGLPRSTSRFSQGSIGVVLQNADLVTVGDHEVRAKNPEPGGGPTAPVLFHILAPPPVPAIDSLAPGTIQAGGAAFALNVYGAGFTPRSIIRWNGGDLTTSRPSTTQLTAVVQSGMIAGAGSATVTVYTPPIGGGVSAGKDFTITPAPVGAVINATEPDTLVIGPDPVPVVLHGSGFTGVDSVRFNNQGNDRYAVVTATSDTVMTVQFDLSWLSSLGIPAIRLHNAAGWGPFYLGMEAVNPVPVIVSLAPDTLDGTKTVDTLIITGSGFVAGMTAMHSVGSLTTQVISFTQIRALVPKTTLLMGGRLGVWVNDPWDYHHSDSLTVFVRSPIPVVDSIVPWSLGQDTVGATSAQFNVWGHDLVLSGTILVDDAPVATYTPNSNVASVILDSSYMLTPHTLMISYRNPLPGGGTSAASFPFMVRQANPPPVIDSFGPAAVRSDSGTQVVTVHGHGFLPGSVAGLQPYLPDDSWLLTDTFPVTRLDDSTLTIKVPDPLLFTGNLVRIQLQAPFPTGRPSHPISIPVWTTGIRTVTTFDRSPMVGFASDTGRGVVYVTDDSAGGTLRALDATTGAELRSLQLPGNAGVLSMGANGTVLYAVTSDANELCRIDLDAWAIQRTFSVGTIPGNAWPYRIGIVAPSTTDPLTVAVFIGYSEMIGGPYLRIYDDTVPRPHLDTLPTSALTARFFGDTLTEAGFGAIRRYTPDSMGLSLLDSVAVPYLLSYSGPALFVRGDRLALSGALLDASNGQLLHSGVDLAGTPVLASTSDRYLMAWITTVDPTSLRYWMSVSRIDIVTGSNTRTIGFGQRSFDAFGVSPNGYLFTSEPQMYSHSSEPTHWNVVESVLMDP